MILIELVFTTSGLFLRLHRACMLNKRLELLMTECSSQKYVTLDKLTKQYRQRFSS